MPSTKTPLLCAARALRDANAAPSDLITLTHEGSDIVALRSTIGAAAALTVVDNNSSSPRFAPYRAPGADVLFPATTARQGQPFEVAPPRSPIPPLSAVYGLAPRSLRSDVCG